MVTQIVGILNITPDSFFDGGHYEERGSALSQLKILLEQGVDVVDIGAESTRPNAVPINEEEEWKRLENILPSVVLEVQKYNQENQKKIGQKKIGQKKIGQKRIEVSLDSRHSKTVAKALEVGIDIINDVSGFDDLVMVELAVKSGKKIVVMHNLGVPANKNKIIDESLDVVQVVINWMENKLEQLLKAGVKKEQIIFDIGIGFGKNSAQSIKLIKEIDRLRVLDLPLYVGHSNKSFLDDLQDSELWLMGGETFRSREDKTIAVSAYLASKNVEYLRVHNILGNKIVADTQHTKPQF